MMHNIICSFDLSLQIIQNMIKQVIHGRRLFKLNI
jgi:hypothetical protein